MTGTSFSQLYQRAPEKACRELFDEYCKYVYTIVFGKLRGCGAAEDIEECVSDVFAEVFFSLTERAAEDKELKGFIATVARRRAINKFHSLTSGTSAISLDSEELEPVSSGDDIEADTENKVLSSELLDAVEALGEPDSTIVLQKFYYDRSSAEIADELGMKPSAVRMRSKRAMARLKKALKKRGFAYSAF